MKKNRNIDYIHERMCFFNWEDLKRDIEIGKTRIYLLTSIPFAVVRVSLK